MTEVTAQEYKDLMKEADRVLSQLTSRLENVTVNVSPKSEDVVEAVAKIFGRDHIKSDGSTTITFEMFKAVSDSIKKIGALKAGEYM